MKDHPSPLMLGPFHFLSVTFFFFPMESSGKWFEFCSSSEFLSRLGVCIPAQRRLSTVPGTTWRCGKSQRGQLNGTGQRELPGEGRSGAGTQMGDLPPMALNHTDFVILQGFLARKRLLATWVTSHRWHPGAVNQRCCLWS